MVNKINSNEGRKMIKKALIIIIGLAVTGLVACSQDEPESAADKVADAAHDAANATKEAAHDAGNAIKEAAHDAQNAVEEAAHDAK